MAPNALFALFAVGDYGHSFQFGGFADQFDDDILSGAHRNLLRFITQVGDHDHIGRSDLERKTAVVAGDNAAGAAFDGDCRTRDSGLGLVEYLTG